MGKASWAQQHVGTAKHMALVTAAGLHFAPASYPLRSPIMMHNTACLARLPSLDSHQPGLHPLGRAIQVKNDILTSSCAVPIPPIWSQEHKAWCMDGCFSDFDLIKVRLWTASDALL